MLDLPLLALRDPMNKTKVAKIITELLTELGEDPQREGLVDTPKRVAKMYEDITIGYKQSLKTVVNDAIFSQKIHNMVVLKDIEMYSLCEHHLVPFFGKVHIGYIANDKVIGISKIARIVDMYARRLQLQERLTEEIAHAIQKTLKPQGVGVVVEGKHLCMMMRGVTKQNAIMKTSTVLGNFRSKQATREEFLAMIQ